LVIKDYHITPEQAAIVARDAGIPYLIITHVLPPVPSQILVNPFLRDARAIYDGEVRMANDGTMVKIPVDSDKITIVELFKQQPQNSTLWALNVIFGELPPPIAAPIA
jgi:ribonuclease Z